MEVDTIQNAVIRDVVLAYKTVFGDLELWERNRAVLNRRLGTLDTMLPVPVIDLDGEKVLDGVSLDLRQNPLEIAPRNFRITRGKFIRGSAGQTAAAIAEYLSRYFIVAYANHSLLVSATYNRQDVLVKESIIMPPVLVYFYNQDGRNNSSLVNMLLSRQYGYSFIVKE